MNHTPGPWEARDVAGAGWQIYAKMAEWNDKHCSIVRFTPQHSMSFHATKDGKIVGMIAYEEWVQFKSDAVEKQWEANAKLVGAAPEMYEALNAIRGLLALEDCDWATAIIRDQVRAALEKAESGSPMTNLSNPYHD